MRIMFMGTPEFAVPSLEALYESGHDVCSVVTRADKPRGRGHKMCHPPIYECAASHGTRIFQPESLKMELFEDILAEENPDLIAVVAYGKILPEYVLNYPHYGCINVHGSLLPKYRGAAPMQRCIINGEKKTGITTMYMDKGLDTGDMLLKAETDIMPEDTFETVHDKLSVLGADLLVKTIDMLAAGTAPRVKQNDSDACYSPMIDKETAKIDWTSDAQSIKNLIRGLYPFPRAYTYLDGKLLKIDAADVVRCAYDCAPGTIVSAGDGDITVKCGKDALSLRKIQLESKKSMTVSDFLRGNNIEINTVLG